MSEWPLACYYLVESYMNEKHPRTRALFEAVMKRDSESINERDWEDMPQKDRDVFEAAINEVFPSVAPEVGEFQPTHRHAEGGLYQLLDHKIDVHYNGLWLPGVRYRNEAGREFVRTWDEWRKRFTVHEPQNGQE